MKQENWYVGQEVWDESLKPGKCGTVSHFIDGRPYPVRVLFDDNEDILYAPNGAFQRNVHPTLKPYPHRIEIHRIEPEFEKGQIVLVRDESYQAWVAARYEAKDEHRYRVIMSLPLSSGSSWVFCIPFAGNEHLLLTTLNP